MGARLSREMANILTVDPNFSLLLIETIEQVHNGGFADGDPARQGLLDGLG